MIIIFFKKKEMIDRNFRSLKYKRFYKKEEDKNQIKFLTYYLSSQNSLKIIKLHFTRFQS